jgi:hypothetical protein
MLEIKRTTPTLTGLAKRWPVQLLQQLCSIFIPTHLFDNVGCGCRFTRQGIVHFGSCGEKSSSTIEKSSKDFEREKNAENTET